MITSKDICFVTGADAAYFLMAGMLAESLAARYPDIRFRLLDFGLSEAQRALSIEKRWFVPRPDGIARSAHPYMLKAYLGRYLGHGRPRVAVWVDCDAVAAGGGTRQLCDALEAMASRDQVLAAAVDAGYGTWGKFVRHQRAPAFAAAARDAAAADAPYINVGVVVFAGDEALERWPAVTERFDGDACFEQNALSVIARELGPRFHLLDNRQWNAHGPLLAGVKPSADGPICGGRKVVFLHATSECETFHVRRTVNIPLDGRTASGVVKWFNDPGLRELQSTHLRAFVRNNLAALRQHGVLAPDPALPLA